MKRKIFICIALFLSIQAYSQYRDTLYCVSGTPFIFAERIDKVTQRPVLFSYNYDSMGLDTVLRLSPQEPFTSVEFIGLYNAFGYLVVLRSLWGDEDMTTFFSIIDLNTMRQHSIQAKGLLTQNLLVFHPDSAYYSINYMEDPTHEIAYNPFGQTRSIEPKDYNYAYIQGQSGTPIQGNEYLRLYNEATNNNALHISKGSPNGVGPYLELQPPKELYNAYPPALKSMIVNDYHSTIISYDDSKPDGNRIGEYYCIVYDKLSEQWYKQTFRGNATNVRSYDNGWVAGTIMDVDEGEHYDVATARYTGEKFNFKRTIPGYEERIPISSDYYDGTPWGDCFDERAQYFGTYYPGLLYLFNVHTKDYIEWDTKQGDSEVLLVQDGFVYYRVNTKILKSAIIDNKQLSTPELLVDDARVRDIHWAYLKK